MTLSAGASPCARWIGVGSSSDADPIVAGRAAAGEALLGSDPKLTFGEIARTRGINAFHHQTLVLLATA